MTEKCLDADVWSLFRTQLIQCYISDKEHEAFE